jgi:hypothetical protein
MDIPQIYHDNIARLINEKGVFPHQMLVEDKDGKLGFMALALDQPSQVMNHMLQVLVKEKPRQLMYGMDRYCKPGQGTTLNDCIGGAYWNGEAWRVFVIEYQHEPRIVKPIDWHNDWWKKSIREELTVFLDLALGQRK